MTLQERATKMAGNHRRFECFVWDARPKDSDRWCLYYTHNRDSGILDRCNAETIARALKPYIGRTVHEEDHNHWACGWIKGFAVKVYTNKGKITAAFRVLAGLLDRMEEYPILDEDRHSMMEWTETLEAWDGAPLRDRIDLCKRAGEPILKARHPLSHDGMNRIEMYVRDRWITP